MGFLNDLLDLMPDNHTEREKYATLGGFLIYDAAPETMALLCKRLRESCPENTRELFTANSQTFEQWAALIREELLCDSSATC